MLVSTEIILNEIGLYVSERLKDDIKNKRITKYGSVNASGRLANSVRYEVTNLGETLKVYAEDYIDYLVYGRSPGKFPPKEPILKWISDKGITPDGISVNSLAYLIQRKIAQKGTTIFEQGGSDLLSGILTDEYVVEMKDKLQSEILNSIRAELAGIAA